MTGWAGGEAECSGSGLQGLVMGLRSQPAGWEQLVAGQLAVEGCAASSEAELGQFPEQGNGWQVWVLGQPLPAVVGEGVRERVWAGGRLASSRGPLAA